MAIPLVIGGAGIVVELLSGELDGRSEKRKERHPIIYHVLFYISLVLMAIALGIAAVLNPSYVENVIIQEIPYIIGGALIVFAVSSFILVVRPHHRIKKQGTDEPSII